MVIEFASSKKNIEKGSKEIILVRELFLKDAKGSTVVFLNDRFAIVPFGLKAQTKFSAEEALKIIENEGTSIDLDYGKVYLNKKHIYTYRII